MSNGEQLAGGTLIAGRYRVVDTLGQGGFGTTYHATDEQTGDDVAVKALDLSRVADWKAVELFEREARTLRQLDHPNIPAYRDFIPVRDDESGYLVQSLAPGEPLDARIRDHGRFDEASIESIAVCTLEVLDYLSSLNPAVVHRDLKPSNLLFDDGAVHLVDFGAVQDAAERTISGGSTVAGTFGYMAPEQLHGVATPSSDLYGLGMTLIHLASGKHPSTLSRNGLRVEFRDDVALRPRLLELIERLAEPDPNDRFRSPAEALDFLRHQEASDGTLDGDIVCPDCGRVNGAHYRFCLSCGTKLDDYSGSSSFGPDMGGVIAEREREEAERRRQQIQKRRAELNARRSRVAVHTTDDELLLEVRPKKSNLALASVAAFLWINPGVFIVGGFPFLGPYWPVFSEFWQLRFVVWTTFVLLAALAVRLRSRAPWRIRLDKNGHFMRYRRDPDSPSDAGRFTDVSVSLFASDTDVGVDAAELTLKNELGEVVFRERWDNLRESDARLVNTVAEWEGFGQAEVTLYDPDGNVALEQPVTAGAEREGWWRGGDT